MSDLSAQPAAIKKYFDNLKDTLGEKLQSQGLAPASNFYKRVDMLNLPRGVRRALNRVQLWRNTAQHGVDGEPWWRRPEGGGSRNALPLPTRSDVKRCFKFINGHVGRINA